MNGVLIQGNVSTYRDTRDVQGPRKNNVRTQQEGNHLKAKDKGIRKNHTADFLVLDF